MESTRGGGGGDCGFEGMRSDGESSSSFRSKCEEVTSSPDLVAFLFLWLEPLDLCRSESVNRLWSRSSQVDNGAWSERKKDDALKHLVFRTRLVPTLSKESTSPQPITATSAATSSATSESEVTLVRASAPREGGEEETAKQSVMRCLFKPCAGIAILGTSFVIPRPSNVLFSHVGVTGKRERTASGEDVQTCLRSYEFAALPVPSLGSFAMLQNAYGDLELYGGWCEDEEEAVDTVYQLDHTQEANWVAAKAAGEDEDVLSNWSLEATLPKALCFLAAARTIHGNVVVCGGGGGPYRGACVYRDTFIRAPGEASWRDVDEMKFVRCGHSAVTMFDDKVWVGGGYGGGNKYFDESEVLDVHRGTWFDVPKMSCKRSGFAADLSFDGCIYVAGGSPDGDIGHTAVERFDPRLGKWETLAPMTQERGYCSGCIARNGEFVVTGGLRTSVTAAPGSIEVYDTRINCWRQGGGEAEPLFCAGEDRAALKRGCHQMVMLL